MPATWHTTRFRIDLSRPRVMGIVNITPDSFSDGGRHATTQAAIAHCEQLLREGADILDLGGESSRPGADPLPLEEEQARVLPVLREALTLGVPVSVDTYKPETMRAALDLGADIVNDIYALRWPGAVEAVAAHPSCGVCLMHMQGEPASMQQRPIYGDVLEDVSRFLLDRAAALTGAGVQRERITLDPGIGFGKTVEHNLALLARQRELLRLGYPLLLGWSRKSSLGALTGRPVEQRQAASLAAALAAAQHGAKVLRVHDVAATVDALKVGEAAGLLPVVAEALLHNPEA
ncbi:dihydropteroate synthase [Piscinibacter sp. HJYY11]|uniref:dihydropteroate synthase n=1 Tax=Piscinibacter sp. HJYY11 TaxID=2801333 RepID=UPI00191EBFE5|nr:dihydropteroate synthase [Piscinibacter sp. HJYY11]MBL0731102.1 dihydropteroate synthase [Piscinibacter sp. HJYY11]